MVILLPFLAGWAALRAAGGWMPAAKLAALSALAFLFACFPWFVRNYVVFHQVVLFRSNFGLELWLGNNEQVPDSWTPELHPNDNEEERAKYLRMGEIAYMAEKEHQAIEFIRTHPYDFGRFVFHRFMHNWTGLWGPVADAFPAAPLLSEVYLTGKCLFSLLAFLGLIFASRSRIEGATPLAVVILVFPIVYIISHTSSRYRHPIEPIMAVLTVYAVAFLGAAVMRKRVGTLAGRASEVSG
jgi:hypothetical protein